MDKKPNNLPPKKEYVTLAVPPIVKAYLYYQSYRHDLPLSETLQEILFTHILLSSQLEKEQILRDINLMAQYRKFKTWQDFAEELRKKVARKPKTKTNKVQKVTENIRKQRKGKKLC